MSKRLALCLFLAFGLVGCDSGTGPGDESTVSILFRARSASPAGSLAPAVEDVSTTTSSSAALTIAGSNGTLTIDDIRFIVAEFELERADADDACDGVRGALVARDDDDDDDDEDDDDDDRDDCEEFETPPQFVTLSLDGEAVPSVVQPVPTGLYEELEFAIEDLDFDDDDGDRSDLEQLRQAILAEVPDWPEDASLLVAGSFTPAGGSPTDFRVFFEAEIEIEIEFPPPGLDLTADADPTVTVIVDPALWFGRPDGTVLDLSQFDGHLVEFEFEMEHGFPEIEFDD